MTKQNFIALADKLQSSMPSEKNAPELFAHWAIMRDALADFCAAQNPAFNRERWLSYIAGKSGKNGGKVGKK